MSTDEQSQQFGASLICPHCKETFRLDVTLASRAMFANQVPKRALPREERFSSYEVSLLRLVEESGLLEAFAAATRTAKGTQCPKDMDKWFLQFMRTAERVIIPQPTLTVLVEEFPGAQIHVYATHGICMVTADGSPVLFCPEVFARTSKSRQERTGFNFDAPVTQLSEWIRTRNGYVASRGLLWSELRGKTAGAFAKPNL
jgi:hypothetical protein